MLLVSAAVGLLQCVQCTTILAQDTTLHLKHSFHYGDELKSIVTACGKFLDIELLLRDRATGGSCKNRLKELGI